MKPVFLKQAIDKESILEGKVKGVSYSGGVIKNFWGYENFVVDVASLTIAKEKSPILRDHNPSQVAGHGVVTINGNSVEIDGILSKKTTFGSEIISLAEDGFEWEQSVGVFDGRLEEVRDTVVNGQMIDHGFVLRDGVLREVSIVALGADSNTFATILSQHKGDQEMLTKEQWIKFACACGGDKDTTPEELEAKMKETKLESEEAAAEIAEKEAEIEALKAKIEELTSEIEKIKEEEAVEEREEQIEMALKAKGVKFAAEKIKDAAQSKEKTEILLSLIEDMKGGIDPKLAKKDDVGGKKPTEGNKPEEIRMAAEKMVKDGLAKDVFDAILKLEVQ
jgi:hypothetical protein